jgi:hypothetical protein
VCGEALHMKSCGKGIESLFGDLFCRKTPFCGGCLQRFIAADASSTRFA